MCKLICCIIILYCIIYFLFYIKDCVDQRKSYDNSFFLDEVDCSKNTIVKNNKGHYYMVMENTMVMTATNEKLLDIYLADEKHKEICCCPRIFATIKDGYIWIDDILAEEEDCGNGSILLELLFEKARELKIDTIKGELSGVDSDRFDKLEYFYNKHGFNVMFGVGSSAGMIEKKITI